MMTLREATEEDIPLILQFVKELAMYEHLENEVVATPQLMRYWIFEQKKASVLFCCHDGLEVGFALYFYNYSTWKGCCGIYIEDLYVQKAYRGKGFGKGLITRIAQIANKEGCARVEWACLDWNQSSIDFYKSLGAKPMEDWSVFRLTGLALHSFSEN
ncbi:acetyltransferase [Sphaerochaeta pleomorpha str. Grapes]|uniref:Acetyltransferase n=1 Tax=Sphaerochaeta pleomorpha (strain ATCC BAA-1885 / DSM 22778 / Grapes) TaxID=158190 RepID=G8QY76_SPHPG|nr:GNAT family N-acetyltransferase [Sphaerochaeta pleomorpha]AEV29641.1 acetyltransferase [Sphaerochaeta pleomorpha str. Grapes]